MPAATVTSSQIIAAVLAAIVALVPGIAPSILFREHTDNTCDIADVTDPGRFRLIKVTIRSPKISAYAARSTGTTNFDQVLTVQIGYPCEDYETIDGESFLVEDLRLTDLEQLRRALDPEALFADLPGVKMSKFQGASDTSDGAVKSISYGIGYGRTT